MKTCDWKIFPFLFLVGYINKNRLGSGKTHRICKLIHDYAHILVNDDLEDEVLYQVHIYERKKI